MGTLKKLLNTHSGISMLLSVMNFTIKEELRTNRRDDISALR